MLKKKIFIFLLASFQISSFSQQNSQNDTIFHLTDHLVILKSISLKSDSFELVSPGGKAKSIVHVGDDGIFYKLYYKGNLVLKPSYLGLKINDTVFTQNFNIEFKSSSEFNENVRLYYKEKTHINYSYRLLILYLRHISGRRFALEFRLSDNTIAFRYKTYNDQDKSYTINAEYSEFSFTQNLRLYYETSTESGYFTTTLDSFNPGILTEIPLLLTNDTMNYLISEANSIEHARSGLKKVKERTIAINLNNSATGKSDYYSPWRYVIFSDNLSEFYDSKYIIYALNRQDTTGLHFLKPGKLFREMRLSTPTAIKCIDFAANMHFQYVLFDAGWYGLGYKNEFNVLSDPFKVIDSINMPYITNYAKSKGIEIMLYLNNVALMNYNMDSAFNLYKSWGIRALKFGFVNGLTQTGRKFTLNMLKKAGDYGFGVIIHDNLRPSGTEQTYLNHLSTEGLRGNEYVTNTAAHTTVLPFSRFMIGAGDYTFCYKNPDNSTLPNMPVSKGHQLAISVAFFSPIQSIMWYGKPEDYTDSVEIEFFKHLPVYWEDSKLLDGAIGRYAVFARKSHDRWFWSAYSYQPLNIRQSCSFLGNDSIYIRTCYRDSAGTISKKKDFVNRFITSYYSLNSNTGCACIFEKTDSVSQVPAISFVPVQDTVHINDTLKYVVFFEKIPPAFTAKSIKIYATFEPNAFQIFDFKSKYFNDNALHIKTEDNHTLITYNQDQPIIFSDTILNFLCIINRNNSFLIDSVYVDENKILVFQKFPCISENTQPINNFASCNFSIYPTLVTDRSINLSFTHPGKYDIKITDITGKIVISKQVDIPFNNQITLDLLPLKKGLYIVKVKSCPYTKKFVIL